MGVWVSVDTGHYVCWLVKPTKAHTLHIVFEAPLRSAANLRRVHNKAKAILDQEPGV